MVHDELGHQTETLLFKKRLMEWTPETETQETYEAEKDGSRRGDGRRKRMEEAAVLAVSPCGSGGSAAEVQVCRS